MGFLSSIAVGTFLVTRGFVVSNYHKFTDTCMDLDYRKVERYNLYIQYIWVFSS